MAGRPVPAGGVGEDGDGAAGDSVTAEVGAMGALAGQRSVQVPRLDLPRVERHTGQAGSVVRDAHHCCAQELAEP
jgi:hypothetical protein